MKRKIMIILSVMLIAGVMGLVFSQSGIVSADPKLSREAIREQVLELYPGDITELELEKEGNKAVYEVEIRVDGKEYELKLDGDTGEVLKLDEKIIVVQKDSDDKTVDQAEQQKRDTNLSKNEDKSGSEDNADDSNRNKSNTSNQTVIGTEEAEQIALENFAGTITELELDDDDDNNRLIYEIEVVDGNRKAEIEIDAYTGEVVLLEIETEDDED